MRPSHSAPSGCPGPCYGEQPCPLPAAALVLGAVGLKARKRFPGDVSSPVQPEPVPGSVLGRGEAGVLSSEDPHASPPLATGSACNINMPGKPSDHRRHR